MRILLAEDDPLLGDGLVSGLRQLGYTVDWVRDGIAAEQALDALVKDTGPGIPQAQQQILFQRFQRGEDVEAQGSGLGLSIVKQIADVHGAEISLTDAQGLVVTVSFPG